MSEGWIKLHRKLLDNPIAQRPEYAWLWTVVLLLAGHDESKFIWKGESRTCKRGEFITSRVKLSQLTGIAQSTVEDILKYLERESQIRQQTNTKFRLITVINYDQYQEVRQQSDSKATTKQQPADTIKNVRMKEEYINTPPTSGDLESLLAEGSEIKHEFQLLGLEVYEFVGSPEGKKGECFRLAKYYPDYCIRAMSEIKILPGVRSRWKMFVWKVNGLIKQHGATQVRKPDRGKTVPSV